ncbi:MAG: CapA family protein [Betaproteobacteria bacterium]
MLLPEATPPPWRLWRMIEHVALHGAHYGTARSEIAVSEGSTTATLLSMGDLALTRPLGFRPQAIFGDLHSLMQRADLRTANLEAVLTERTQRAGSYGSFIRAAPGNAALLRAAPFDVLNIANNHALDFGEEALQDTLDSLERESIAACGVKSGTNRENLAIRVAAGLRVGFIGFCDDYRASAPANGGPRPAEATADTIAATIAAALPRVDFLVCHVHWGYEFSLHPLLRHRELARAMIRSGADLVLCHHAHVPAGIEVLGSGAIAYGLGNAVMPMSDYMRDGHPWSRRSFMLEAQIGVHAVRRLRLHPFGVAADGRIEALVPAHQRDILAGVARLSARLHDAEFLDRIERCRLVYETHALLQSLEQAAHAGANQLQERLLSLHIPRQRQLLDYIGRLPQFMETAGALTDLARIAPDGEAVAARYASLRPVFNSSLPALRSAYRWRDALRTRIP